MCYDPERVAGVADNVGSGGLFLKRSCTMLRRITARTLDVVTVIGLGRPSDSRCLDSPLRKLPLARSEVGVREGL